MRMKRLVKEKVRVERWHVGENKGDGERKERVRLGRRM